MNLLLDTQALLWFVLDDSRLSETARESIVAADGMVFVSPASLWEIAIKISLGKYVLPMPFAAFWDDQLPHRRRHAAARHQPMNENQSKITQIPQIFYPTLDT